MFYANQTIHFPDSPRHMNAGAWATGTTVAMRNVHTDMLSDGLPVIDLRHHVDDIAEGVVYLSPEEQQYDESSQFFSLVYKFPAGLYEQFGIADKYVGDNKQSNGSIFIPVPDTFVLVRGRVMDTSTPNEPGFAVRIDRISLGSHYPFLLPYTNLYNGTDMVSEAHSVQEAEGRYIEYRQLCFGDFFKDVTSERFSARMDGVNAVVALIPSLLFSNGNADLPPRDTREDLASGMNRNVERGFRNDEYSRRTYHMYWYTLALLHNHVTTDVYPFLSDWNERGRGVSGLMNDFSDVGITLSKIDVTDQTLVQHTLCTN